MKVLNHTPAIDMAVSAMEKYRMTESGKLLGERNLHIGDEPAALQVKDEDGVLILSATPGLEPGGLFRSMAQQDPRHLALFGIRSWRSDEYAFVQAKRVQAYSMMEISREGLHETTDAVMAYVRTWKRFHLIIDINILDPAFVPGLRSPVPGGLSTRDLLYVVQRLQLIRSLGEISIIFDSHPQPATSEVVGHLLAELHTL